MDSSEGRAPFSVGTLVIRMIISSMLSASRNAMISSNDEAFEDRLEMLASQSISKDILDSPSVISGRHVNNVSLVFWSFSTTSSSVRSICRMRPAAKVIARGRPSRILQICSAAVLFSSLYFSGSDLSSSSVGKTTNSVRSS